MTRVSCPSCRLRFGAAATAILSSCPECGRHLEAVTSAEEILGFIPVNYPFSLDYPAVRDIVGGFGADLVMDCSGHPSAGPEGIEILVFGARHEGDGETISDWWTE